MKTALMERKGDFIYFRPNLFTNISNGSKRNAHFEIFTFQSNFCICPKYLTTVKLLQKAPFWEASPILRAFCTDFSSNWTGNPLRLLRAFCSQIISALSREVLLCLKDTQWRFINVKIPFSHFGFKIQLYPWKNGTPYKFPVKMWIPFQPITKLAKLAVIV